MLALISLLILAALCAIGYTTEFRLSYVVRKFRLRNYEVYKSSQRYNRWIMYDKSLERYYGVMTLFNDELSYGFFYTKADDTNVLELETKEVKNLLKGFATGNKDSTSKLEKEDIEIFL